MSCNKNPVLFFHGLGKTFDDPLFSKTCIFNKCKATVNIMM